MEGKLAGLGLKNLVLVAMFVMVAIVMAKAIFIKHPVPGVTPMVAAI